MLERAEVDAGARLGLGREHTGQPLAVRGVTRRDRGDPLHLRAKVHGRKNAWVLATGFSIAFAVAVLVVAAAFGSAATGRLSPRVARLTAIVLGVVAVAGWIALAFEPELATAVAAAGLSLSALALIAADALAKLTRRTRRVDADFARAEEQLRTVVEQAAAERAAELERTLARARADSVSLLAEEERRLGEERRRALVDREAAARDELAAALTAAHQQVERRLAEWAQDLERIQEGFAGQISRVGEHQVELIAQVEARVTADAERILGENEEQRAAVARLREELARSLEEVAQAADAELEAQAAERRRALHEVSDRLRRREEALRQQLEREETEAAGRITAGFAEIERRQLEQLQRVIDRASSGYSELAAQQFDEAIRNAREESATRLRRELERAVAAFERDATGVLSDQLAQISDSGTQRLEKRLGQIAAGLERQRDDAVSRLERRFTDVETEILRRAQALLSDVEAERAVIDARLEELSRRIEETYARTS